MKLKIFITTASLLISGLSYASLADCSHYGMSGNDALALKYCKPYVEKDPDATMVYAGALDTKDNDYSEVLKYTLWAVNYYQNNGLPSSVTAKYTYMKGLSLIGNIYYFGQGVPVDHNKGLTYIIESANLGNDIAQNQLGEFYASDDKFPGQNVPKSYKWYYLAEQNENQDAPNSYLMSNIDAFKAKYPICIAQGKTLVGNAYAQGIGGLTQSTSKAMDWYQQGYQIDHISPVATTLAQAYLAQGDKDKALEIAKVAIQQPYPQAFVLMAQLSNDPVAQYTYLSIATELYNKPDTAFWDKFEQPCRPELNSDGLADAKAQLNAIKIDKAQQAKAGQMISEIKKGWK